MDEDRIGKKSKGMNSKINVSIILIIIVLISLPQILSFSKENEKIEKNVTYFSENGSKPQTNGINLTDKDKEFMNWFGLTYIPIKNDLVCISDAAKKENFSETQRCARFLKEDSQRSINQSQFNNQLNESALDKYIQSLENYYIGGKSLEIGAKNRDILLMSNATAYIKEGNIQIRNIMDSFPRQTPFSNNFR